MDNKQGTGNTSGTADSSAAAFMADLLQKIGGPEKAMEAFAMFAAAMGKSVPAVSTSAVPPPEVSGVSTPQPEAVVETTTVPDTSAAETHEDDADLVEGLGLLAVSEPRLDSVTEGETPVLDDEGVEVSEGVNPVVAAVDFVEKETLNESVNVDLSAVVDSRAEGETPVLEEFVERVTPAVCDDIPKGGETLISEGIWRGKPQKCVGASTPKLLREMSVRGGPPRKPWVLRPTMLKVRWG